MGIFGSVFGKKSPMGQQQEEKQLPWVPLEKMEQLEQIMERSRQRPQLIYKHSATCGISSMVLRSFNASLDPQWDCDMYFLTIQANRGLSREVEASFGVRHESPQLLILRQGETIFHTSHGAIAHADLTSYIK